MLYWLKILGLNFIVWIAGSIAFGWLLLRDIENNPVPLNADGTLPGDSPALPIIGTSLLFYFFLILANGVYFFVKRHQRKSVQ